MSRIGIAPIAVPAGVDVKVDDANVITVKGPLGTLTYAVNPKMTVKIDGATLTVERASSSAGEYKGQTIYTVDNNFKVELTSANWTSHNDGEYYTYTINADTVKDAITIGEFHLPSEDDYNEFKTAIQDVKFRVKVSPAA